MKPVRKSDIRLTPASTKAARDCVEAAYFSGMGIESAFALLKGIRNAAEIETVDDSEFDDNHIRIFYRTFGLVTPKIGLHALKAEKLLDELERIALSDESVDRIWDTLAAVVGDAEPSDADRRVVEIFRALRNDDLLNAIAIKKSPRPSKRKVEAAISLERELKQKRREQYELEKLSNAASKQQSPQEPEADINSTLEINEVEFSPGKIALRLLKYLHEGYVIVTTSDLPDSGSSVSRFIPSLPKFDRAVNPRLLIENTIQFKMKHYDFEYGYELEMAGWIEQLQYDGGGRDVYVLTAKGKVEAEKAFGKCQVPVMVYEDRNLDQLKKDIERLFAKEVSVEEFAYQQNIETDDVEDFLYQASYVTDIDDACIREMYIRETNSFEM